MIEIRVYDKSDHPTDPLYSVITIIILTVIALWFTSTTFLTNEITGKYPRYKINGLKLSGDQLKEEIYKTAEAVPYYRKAKTSKTMAYVILAPLAVTALLLSPKDAFSGTTEYRRKQTSYYIATTLFSASVIYFILNNKKQLKKAVRIRNEKLGFTSY